MTFDDVHRSADESSEVATALTIVVDDDHIASYDLGGNGPPVLYAHANGFHARCWQPVADHLPQFQNIAYDARGHGNTPIGAGWASNDNDDWLILGNDASAVARSVVTGPHSQVIGMGHSMGGATLLMAALAEPQLFRGLVVYEPIVMPPELLGPATRKDNQLAKGARKRRSSFASFEDAIANYTAKPPMNTFAAEAIEAYVRHGFAPGPDGRVHLKCAPEHEARMYEAAPGHRTWERLGEIAVPVWVLSELARSGHPSAWAEQLAARIPNSRYIHLDHLDHFGPMQAPAEIAQMIAQAASGF